LGKHRLMCGDSTKREDVAKLMNGKTARFVFTDPPWNVDYGGAKHPSWKQRSILNDKMSTSQFAEFLSMAFTYINEVLEVGGMNWKFGCRYKILGVLVKTPTDRMLVFGLNNHKIYEAAGKSKDGKPKVVLQPYLPENMLMTISTNEK